MKAIETLMTEHRAIERVLDALVSFTAEIAKKSLKGEKERLLQFVEFIVEFADRTHHGKEEDILFKTMMDAGFPKDAGPLAVMLAEHDEGRLLTSAMRETGKKPDDWTPADRQKILRTATGYVNLLRQHIQKEDTILYPMAQAHLGAELFGEIERKFRKFTDEEQNQGRPARFEKLVGDLTAG